MEISTRDQIREYIKPLLEEGEKLIYWGSAHQKQKLYLQEPVRYAVGLTDKRLLITPLDKKENKLLQYPLPDPGLFKVSFRYWLLPVPQITVLDPNGIIKLMFTAGISGNRKAGTLIARTLIGKHIPDYQQAQNELLPALPVRVDSPTEKKDDFIEYNLEGIMYKMPLPAWWHDIEMNITADEIRAIASSHKKEEKFKQTENCAISRFGYSTGTRQTYRPAMKFWALYAKIYNELPIQVAICAESGNELEYAIRIYEDLFDISKKIEKNKDWNYTFLAGEIAEQYYKLGKIELARQWYRTGSRFFSHPDPSIKQHARYLSDMESKIESGKTDRWKIPIAGKEIMEMFGLPPSKEIGILNKELRDAILSEEIPNTYEAARQFLLAKAEELQLKPVK